MMRDLTYAEAIENREHLIALGLTDIHLWRNAEGFPWSKVVRVETGGGYRLNGPSGCNLIAEDAELKFILSIDFEQRGANGTGTHLFDRDRLRETMRKIPVEARHAFAALLENEVLPAVTKITAEVREALNRQADSEDCVRGLLTFARETA